MKKYLIGMVAGVILATTASVYADEGLEKVEAYLRPSLPITLNGQEVKLESSPVMYDGSTYLKLRDVAALTGLEVNWNDATQTVELGTNGGKSVENVTTAAQEQKDQAIRTQKMQEYSDRITVLMNEEESIQPIIAPYDEAYVVNGKSTGKEKDATYFEAIRKRDELRKEIEDLTQKLKEVIKEQNDFAESKRQEIINQK